MGEVSADNIELSGIEGDFRVGMKGRGRGVGWAYFFFDPTMRSVQLGGERCGVVTQEWVQELGWFQLRSCRGIRCVSRLFVCEES